MKTYASRKDKRLTSKSSKAFMIPLILVMSILPLIMLLYEYDSGLSIYKWFPDNNSQMDIFLYYKQKFFIIVCSVMLILVIFKAYKERKNIKFLPTFIPLALYGLLALTSTIFSEHPSFGLKGMHEQFESIFVILGYCLLVYYAYLFIDTEEDIKFLFRYFLIGIAVMIVIGLLQFTGNDPFGANYGKKLYLPKEYWNQLDSFGLTFGDRIVYLTLYNPNYAGLYTGFILPIITGLLLTERRKKQIIEYSIVIIGLILCLIGSKSKAGFIGLLISLIFVVIFFRKYIFRNKVVTISLIGVGVLAMAFLFIIKGNAISNAMNHVLNPAKSNYALTNIKTEEALTITYKNNDLVITSDPDNVFNIIMKDASGNDIPFTYDAETAIYTITDERFAGIRVVTDYLEDILCTQVTIDGKDWIFSNQLGDGTYYYLNVYGKFDKIEEAESALFTGHESIATGRGYIWSRSIPLLKDNIILGSGADTFALEFPHQDYVNYYNAGFEGEVLTKPHSLYLQIGVQSGVISLIAFITFYLMYFISSFKLYIKGHFDNFFKQAGVSIFLGTIAYMIIGISNDSTLTVAPIAWALIGVGIACNYKVKGQMEC